MDRLLLELDTIAKENFSENLRLSSLSAVDIAETLCGHAIRISREGSEGEIAETISLLFASTHPPCALSFLTKSVSTDARNADMGTARMKLCQMFDEFIREVGKNQIGEVSHVVEVLSKVFRSEMTSKFKCAVLKPLQTIVELDMIYIDSTNVTELIEWLFEDYSTGKTGTSRTSKTAQAEILVTLGLLGKRFPASMSEWAKSIVGCCIHQIRSDPNKTPYVTFCGATKCLGSLLKDYSTHLVKDQMKFL